MFSFILRRLSVTIPTFLGITVLAFALIHMIPGDPVLVMVGERRLDPEFYRQALVRLGLDQPLYMQYWNYLLKVLQGDLGQSLVSHEPVIKDFWALFPATLELSICAMLLASVFGLIIGMIAAIRRGSWIDHTVMGAALTGYSMPVFWLGLQLIMLFSVQLGWTPVSGRIDLEYDITRVTGLMLIDTLISGEAGAFKSAFMHLILPTIVLGTIPMAVIARMTRSSMLEVLREEYIRTARAKGLSKTRIVLVHALRNALMTVVTVIGLQVGTMLAGAVLTESIFSWPGIGKWLIDSISRRDYPVVQGGILLIATLIIIVNLLVDVLYGVINPRIRHAR
ncbi:ABC transporter permease subunit [Iodobacter fluviatilis]|uniref:Dipeptide transport system permease protein n=1 Tax=Iodobacter fluviatilis TaxID=537 RepID=A0A377STD3_9NEIS|nr:ABC transporter permease subunit [Iodobacter fluviatilis]TCU86189.1 dipeptide transport system permease protein [Iodobacter fluviatilis]STR44600.1 Dipeptide transport system permease protein dppB [Iodobacter fluviatilis]